MKTSWQSDTGHLACHWSEVGQRDKYDPCWMKEASEVQSGYLPPLPDFTSHSPFGGVSWFQPNPTGRE
jgi:hypothetical protein